MFEKAASRRILTEMTTALFRRKKSKTEDVCRYLNHQYIDIPNTNNHTEITLSSCSILVLKSLLKFISQCSLWYPILKALCVKMEMSWITAISLFHSQDIDLLEM